MTKTPKPKTIEFKNTDKTDTGDNLLSINTVSKRYRFNEIEDKDGFILRHSLSGSSPVTASNYEVFFIAPYDCQLLKVSEVHRVAGNDGSAVTLNIEKLTGTQALDAGVSVGKSGFDLKGTANTVVTKEAVDLQNYTLDAGDRLALEDTGVLTAVAGLTVTLYLIYQDNGNYRY